MTSSYLHLFGLIRYWKLHDTELPDNNVYVHLLLVFFLEKNVWYRWWRGSWWVKSRYQPPCSCYLCLNWLRSCCVSLIIPPCVQLIEHNFEISESALDEYMDDLANYAFDLTGPANSSSPWRKKTQWNKLIFCRNQENLPRSVSLCNWDSNSRDLLLVQMVIKMRLIIYIYM